MNTATRYGYWMHCGDSRYWVELARDNTLIEAFVEVRAHDKKVTERRVVNKKTLARLQAAIRPSTACPTCGAEK